MRTATKNRDNPIVQAFLAKLRTVACGLDNPDGIIAETLAANLGTKTATLRNWLQGVYAPPLLTVQALQRKLDKISNLTASATVPASPAGQILGSGRVGSLKSSSDK